MRDFHHSCLARMRANTGSSDQTAALGTVSAWAGGTTPAGARQPKIVIHQSLNHGDPICVCAGQSDKPLESVGRPENAGELRPGGDASVKDHVQRPPFANHSASPWTATHAGHSGFSAQRASPHTIACSMPTRRGCWSCYNHRIGLGLVLVCLRARATTPALSFD